MTLAARFAAAVAAESADSDDDGHLLPERLARAAARVLPVDGVGLSLQAGAVGRLPLGASSPDAERAERLQFTVGTGPCLLALTTGQPAFLLPDDLRRRWPVFTDLLFATTPYRGVVSLPGRHALSGTGAMDLFLTDAADVPRLEVFDALAVTELVSSALGDAVIWSTWSEASGPDWLHSPAAERRAAVWQAVALTGTALEVGNAAALALLRAHAYAGGRSVDSVAADLVGGRLSPADVAGRPGVG